MLKRTFWYCLACLLVISCEERISPDSGKEDPKTEFAAIDLGLPSGLKWANMNLGASSTTDYGDYFAWGETSTKTAFSMDNYKWYDTAKYRTTLDFDDGKTTLDAADDAARMLLGEKWRMPNQKDFRELIQNCNCSWGKQGGVNGLIVKSKTNGNTIFFPSGGVKSGYLTGALEIGRYWTSNLLPDGAYYYGVVLKFTEVDCLIDSFPCDRGLLIRAVTK